MTKEQSMTSLEQAARDYVREYPIRHVHSGRHEGHYDEEQAEAFLAGANHVLDEQRKRAGQTFEKWYDSTGYYRGEGFQERAWIQQIAWSARQPEIDAKDERIRELGARLACPQNIALLGEFKDRSEMAERIRRLEDELLRMWSLKSRTDKEYYAQQGTYPLARQLADQGSKDD